MPKAIDEEIMLDVALECMICWSMFECDLRISGSMSGCVPDDDSVKCWDTSRVELYAYACLLAAEMTHT